MAKEGLSSEAGAQLGQSLSSPVARGFNAAGLKLASAGSGIPSDAIQTYSGRLLDVDKLAEPGALDNFVNSAHKEITTPRDMLHSEITNEATNYVEQQKNAFREATQARVKQSELGLAQKLEALKAQTKQAEEDRARHSPLRLTK